MKNKFIAAFSLFVISLNFVAVSAAGLNARPASKGSASELVALLPASDAVITMDARRVFGEAVPRILSSNQVLLGTFTAKIDEMQAKTGIDLRQFDSVAAGFSIRKLSAKDFDYDPVVIARGQINSSALVGAAKLAANGKYREEKLGTHTMYIFAAKDLEKLQGVRSAAAKKPETAPRVAGKLAADMAVTAYDANTIAAGTPARLRELIAARTHVSPELKAMLGRTEGSIIDFASKVPAGVRALVPMDSDELGKNIDSIRYLYGSMSIADDAASLRATARTVVPQQAQGLKETLDGLQMIGKAFLGSAKGNDKQVFARMIENAKFTVSGNEVSIDLRVPQSDIDTLIGSVKLSSSK